MRFLLLACLLVAPFPRRTSAQEPKDAFGDSLPKGAVARVGTLRLNHAGYVQALIFSPDEKLLLSFGDHGLRSWHVETGKPADIGFRLFGARGQSLAFSPDGKMLAVGIKTDVYVLEYPSGKTLQSLRCPGGCLQHLAFINNGAALAAAEENSRVSIWDTKTWTHRLVEMGIKGDFVVTRIVDGKPPLVYLSDGTGTVHRWCLAPVAWPDGLLSFKNAPRDFDLGKNHAAFVSVHGLTIRQDDKDTVFDLRGHILASRDRLLAVGDDSGGITLFQMDPLKKLRTISHSTAWASALAFSPSGRYLASANKHGLMCIWDIKKEKDVVFDGLDGAQRLAFLDNHTALVRSRGTLFLVDLAKETKKPIGQFPDEGTWVPLLKGKAVVAQDRESIYFIDLPGKGRRAVPRPAHGFLVAAENTTLFAWVGDNRLSFWNFSADKPQLLVSDTLKRMTAAAMTPDAKRLIVGNHYGRIQILNIADGKETLNQWLREPRKGRTLEWIYIGAIAAAPDNRHCYISSSVGAWKLDLATGPKLFPLKIRENHAALAVSPKEDIVAAGFGHVYNPDSPQATLCDTRTGEALCDIRGHDAPVGHVAFSPDGRYLATSSHDNTVLIWDIHYFLKK